MRHAKGDAANEGADKRRGLPESWMAERREAMGVVVGCHRRAEPQLGRGQEGTANGRLCGTLWISLRFEAVAIRERRSNSSTGNVTVSENLSSKR